MKDRIRDAFAEIHADEALIEKTRFSVVNNKRPERKKHFFSFVSITAASILFCILYFTPVAYVSIDINPSLELTLNRFDRVINTYAFNDDGAHVLSSAGLWGRTYRNAATQLLSIINAKGYIVDEALITVTVQAENDEKEQKLCGELLTFMSHETQSGQAAAEVEVYPVTAEVRKNAHGCHMSPAKFLALQELIEADNSTNIEDYNDASIQQIKRRTQECRSGHTETNSNSSEVLPQSTNGHGRRGRHHDHSN